MRVANSLNGAVSVSISRSACSCDTALLHPGAGLSLQCLSTQRVVHVSARVLLRDLPGLDAARVCYVFGRSRLFTSAMQRLWSAKACGHATKCGFVLPDWETSIGLRCLRPYRPQGVARRLARARLRRLKGLDGAGSTQPGIGPHTDPGTGPLARAHCPRTHRRAGECPLVSPGLSSPGRAWQVSPGRWGSGGQSFRSSRGCVGGTLG